MIFTTFIIFAILKCSENETINIDNPRACVCVNCNQEDIRCDEIKANPEQPIYSCLSFMGYVCGKNRKGIEISYKSSDDVDEIDDISLLPLDEDVDFGLSVKASGEFVKNNDGSGELQGFTSTGTVQGEFSMNEVGFNLITGALNGLGINGLGETIKNFIVIQNQEMKEETKNKTKTAKDIGKEMTDQTIIPECMEEVIENLNDTTEERENSINDELKEQVTVEKGKIGKHD